MARFGFDDLFDGLFEDFLPKKSTRPSYNSDIKLTAEQATIAVELPGVLPADVKVWWEGERLNIEAIDNRKSPASKVSLSYYLHGDNRAETKASLYNGILTVVVPRTVVGKRVINVQVQS